MPFLCSLHSMGKFPESPPTPFPLPEGRGVFVQALRACTAMWRSYRPSTPPREDERTGCCAAVLGFTFLGRGSRPGHRLPLAAARAGDVPGGGCSCAGLRRLGQRGGRVAFLRRGGHARGTGCLRRRGGRVAFLEVGFPCPGIKGILCRCWKTSSRKTPPKSHSKHFSAARPIHIKRKERYP